jgi:molybdopterin converting factor small subunit
LVTKETLTVRVQLFGFGHHINRTPTTLITLPKSATIGDLLEHWQEKEGAELPEYLVAIVNGRNAHYLQGNATRLSDQDEVTLMRPLIGG